MTLDEMKKWIQHSETVSLLKNGLKTQNEMATICHKVNKFYEIFHLYPILLKPSNMEKYFDKIDWNFHSSEPKIISLNRGEYLGTIVRKRYPNLRRILNKYIDENDETLAIREQKNHLDKSNFSISIRVSDLNEFLIYEKRVLVILLEGFRYSERTLKELELLNDRQEIFRSDYCYSFSARPWSNCCSTDRSMFSTITTIRGKTLYKLT